MKRAIDNEPEIKIKGGPIRTSKRIDRSEFPALQARERVLNMFTSARPRIARSCVFSIAGVRLCGGPCHRGGGRDHQCGATVRYNAIAALASAGPPENLNQLIDLAHFGEDFYVRGHALLALGATGNADRSSGNCRAFDCGRTNSSNLPASKAVALITKKTSIEGVKAHSSLLDEKSRAQISHILAEFGKAKTRGKVHMNSAEIERNLIFMTYSFAVRGMWPPCLAPKYPAPMRHGPLWRMRSNRRRDSSVGFVTVLADH